MARVQLILELGSLVVESQQRDGGPGRLDCIKSMIKVIRCNEDILKEEVEKYK